MAPERGPNGVRQVVRRHSQICRWRAKTREIAARNDSGLKQMTKNDILTMYNNIIIYKGIIECTNTFLLFIFVK